MRFPVVTITGKAVVLVYIKYRMAHTRDNRRRNPGDLPVGEPSGRDWGRTASAGPMVGAQRAGNHRAHDLESGPLNPTCVQASAEA